MKHSTIEEINAGAIDPNRDEAISTDKDKKESKSKEDKTKVKKSITLNTSLWNLVIYIMSTIIVIGVLLLNYTNDVISVTYQDNVDMFLNIALIAGLLLYNIGNKTSDTIPGKMITWIYSTRFSILIELTLIIILYNIGYITELFITVIALYYIINKGIRSTITTLVLLTTFILLGLGIFESKEILSIAVLALLATGVDLLDSRKSINDEIVSKEVLVTIIHMIIMVTLYMVIMVKPFSAYLIELGFTNQHMLIYNMLKELTITFDIYGVDINLSLIIIILMTLIYKYLKYIIEGGPSLGKITELTETVSTYKIKLANIKSTTEEKSMQELTKRSNTIVELNGTIITLNRELEDMKYAYDKMTERHAEETEASKVLIDRYKVDNEILTRELNTGSLSLNMSYIKTTANKLLTGTYLTDHEAYNALLNAVKEVDVQVSTAMQDDKRLSYKLDAVGEALVSLLNTDILDADETVLQYIETLKEHIGNTGENVFNTTSIERIINGISINATSRAPMLNKQVVVVITSAISEIYQTVLNESKARRARSLLVGHTNKATDLFNSITVKVGLMRGDHKFLDKLRETLSSHSSTLLTNLSNVNTEDETNLNNYAADGLLFNGDYSDELKQIGTANYILRDRQSGTLPGLLKGEGFALSKRGELIISFISEYVNGLVSPLQPLPPKKKTLLTYTIPTSETNSVLDIISARATHIKTTDNLSDSNSTILAIYVYLKGELLTKSEGSVIYNTDNTSNELFDIEFLQGTKKKIVKGILAPITINNVLHSVDHTVLMSIK